MAAFTVIDHQELGASAWAPSGSTNVASWTKSSIPSTYDHLLIKASIRTTASNWYSNTRFRFNSDTGTNYSSTRLMAVDTSTFYTGSFTGQDHIYGAFTCGANTTANTFGSMSLWIPHYSNTTNYKQVIIDAASENNDTASDRWMLSAGAALWQSSSAINEITCYNSTGNLAQYSTITLYGVTGA